MGKADKMDKALADFAVAYADQNERDYEAFMEAVTLGPHRRRGGPLTVAGPHCGEPT